MSPPLCCTRDRLLKFQLSNDQKPQERKVWTPLVLRVWNFRHDTTLSCLVFSVKTIEKNHFFGKPLLRKSKQYLYNIFHTHSSQFLILMAQKSEEIMPDPDAIIRLRRDRLLGANLTGCDVNFCWMIQIQKKCQALWSVLPRPWSEYMSVECKLFSFIQQ